MNEVKKKISYYENGQKSQETPYIDGQQHGVATWWYSNGQKWQETPYVDGQQHGVETWWHQDGSLWHVQRWHQGEMLVRFVFSKGEVPADAEVEVDLMTNEFCLI